jgi:NAD(P)H-dependent FMN reductase
MGQYTHEHTKAWAEAINRFDGFIFVTAEYNHSVPGALKNALDYVYAEWNNKAAGFVSYGSAGGVRAVENLRLITAELQMAGVRAQVALPFASEFENYTVFTPSDDAEAALKPLLDQLISWATALKTLRT